MYKCKHARSAKHAHIYYVHAHEHTVSVRSESCTSTGGKKLNDVSRVPPGSVHVPDGLIHIRERIGLIVRRIACIIFCKNPAAFSVSIVKRALLLTQIYS